MQPSAYPEQPLRDASVSEVLPDDRRRFLVVSGTWPRTGEAWTLVLERQEDYWISRRELSATAAPQAAVTGTLFDREGIRDPVRILRRMNELLRGEYYRILREKMKGDRERNELIAEMSRLRAQVERFRQEQRPPVRTARRRGSVPRASRRRRLS